MYFGARYRTHTAFIAKCIDAIVKFVIYRNGGKFERQWNEWRKYWTKSKNNAIETPKGKVQERRMKKIPVETHKKALKRRKIDYKRLYEM